MKLCIITDAKTSYSSKKFRQEVARIKDKVLFASWKNIIFDSEKGIFLNGKIPLKKFDAVILRSSTTSLTPLSLILDYCKYNKIRLLNKDFYIYYQSINKLRQQILFQEKKIPCLRTIYGESLSFSIIKKNIGLPFIAKLANGSLGKQVFIIKTSKDFFRFISNRKKDRQLYLFQKFYKKDGDYRVFIIGKEVFGPVKRIAPAGEWRTNVHGSKHEQALEKKQLLDFAKIFIKKTSLEFAGLDILIDSAGKPRVIEINTMAGFKIFDEIYPEINIAKKTLALLKK